MAEDDGTNLLSAKVGRSIRTYRQRLGLSQEALAARHRSATGRSQAPRMTRIVVAATEAGERHIKVDELPGFCKALGVSMWELLEDIPEAAPMIPRRDRGLDYATLSDPERLSNYLMLLITPMVERKVEQLTRETLRQSLKGVLGDA